MLLALALAAIFALALSVWVYRAGGGLLLAGLTYSLAGSGLLVLFAGVIAWTDQFVTELEHQLVAIDARPVGRPTEPAPRDGRHGAEPANAKAREPEPVEG